MPSVCSHLIANLPLLCLLCMLLLATFGPAPGLAFKYLKINIMIDKIFRNFGTMLPFIVLFVRGIIHPLPYLYATEVLPKAHGAWFMPTYWSWLKAILCIYVSFTVVRLILFAIFVHHKFYLSDHILLAVCILSLVQTELVHPLIALKTEKRSLITFAVGWFIVICVLIEAYTTACYYHTHQATWTAFVVGVAVFGVPAFAWTNVVFNANERRDEEPCENDYQSFNDDLGKAGEPTSVEDRFADIEQRQARIAKATGISIPEAAP